MSRHVFSPKELAELQRTVERDEFQKRDLKGRTIPGYPFHRFAFLDEAIPIAIEGSPHLLKRIIGRLGITDTNYFLDTIVKQLENNGDDTMFLLENEGREVVLYYEKLDWLLYIDVNSDSIQIKTVITYSSLTRNTFFVASNDPCCLVKENGSIVIGIDSIPVFTRKKE